MAEFNEVFNDQVMKLITILLIIVLSDDVSWNSDKRQVILFYVLKTNGVV